MPTTYPNQIQTFPTMQNISTTDAALVTQYQNAMQAGNLSLALQILSQITNSQNKIVSADYLNTINDTLVALQTYFNQRYSPAYVVSANQPVNQEPTDFWFQIV